MKNVVDWTKQSVFKDTLLCLVLKKDALLCPIHCKFFNRKWRICKLPCQKIGLHMYSYTLRDSDTHAVIPQQLASLGRSDLPLRRFVQLLSVRLYTADTPDQYTALMFSGDSSIRHKCRIYNVAAPHDIFSYFLICFEDSKIPKFSNALRIAVFEAEHNQCQC